MNQYVPSIDKSISQSIYPIAARRQVYLGGFEVEESAAEA
jgi:hypothetical protein